MATYQTKETSSVFDAAERNAFEKCRKLLNTRTIVNTPAGSAPTFPDFGFQIKVPNPSNPKTFYNVDVIFEYKSSSAKSPLTGTTRVSWDGEKFSYDSQKNEEGREEELELIAYLNTDTETKSAMNEKYQFFKTIFNSKIMSSSVVTSFDMKERKKRVELFSKVASPLTFLNRSVNNSFNLARKKLNRQIKKYVSQRSSKADCVVCFFVVDKQIWLVDIVSANLKQEDELAIFDYVSSLLTPSGTIDLLPATVRCTLEGRLRPSTADRVRLEIRFTLKLNQIPTNGTDF